MTLLQKMDMVFEWLYLNSGSNPDFQALLGGIGGPHIEIGEIRDILLKLKSDKFIYCEYEGDLEAEYTDFSRYLVTFDGKFFWESTGGYGKQAESRTIDERIKNSRETYLSRGTVWLAILTGFLVLIETLDHWREISCLFSRVQK